MLEAAGEPAYQLMSANDQPAARKAPRSGSQEARREWLGVAVWILAVCVLGITVGAVIAYVHDSGPNGNARVSTQPAGPVAAWAAGAKPAPAFTLVDGGGAPISLRQFRGRPLIVTFIDPVCRSLCPLEAKQLNAVVMASPKAQRPAIVAISVNPWMQSHSIFRQDGRKWRLVHGWHWAAGGYRQLAPVWKRYDVGVLDRKTVVDGHTIHDVSHTEAAYLIDASGHERALFLYPFLARDLTSALRRL
jgi:cytochrome oxidase Cu insertion factor (SCO1/SenC/PrrC family)